MMFDRRGLMLGGATWLSLSSHAPQAQAQDATIRIGVMTDMAGPFADITGQGSVAATRMAVEEAARSLGIRAEVVFADHQNRPDIANTVMRRWIDREGIDVVVDVPGSSAALAAAGVVKEKNKVYLACAPGTSELTGAQCNANTVHWVYDTWMLANTACRALVAMGGDSWYFVTADYAFGHSMEADGSAAIRNAGGRVLGSTRYPFPETTDYSAFLLRAQASRAKVIGLANAGSDTINCVKQAAEFGISRNQKLAALNLFITEVHVLGLQAAQGLICSESFYWNQNDRTRAFSQRLRQGYGIAAPTRVHAGCYSATLHYLKAVKAMGVAAAKASGADAVARMKAMPTDDDAFGPGTIRADGRKLHDALLLQVKAPGESQAPWDYYKVLSTTPADQAFRPMSEGGCPLVAR